MNTPLPVRFFVLMIGLLAATTAWAAKAPNVEQTGPDTYTITKTASTGFNRDVDGLKDDVLAQAKAFCATKGREIKVLSLTGDKPRWMFTGYTKATIVFKALEASDPELHTPVPAAAADGSPAASYAPAPATPTDELYNELTKLDDLRKRGILTDEEFQAQKKKVLDRSK
jgi:hypothetical protein